MAEAKARVSYAEAQIWFAYRQRYGGIGHARNARLLSLLTLNVNRAAGGDAEFEDIFYADPPPPTLQDVMNELLKAM